MDFADSIDRCSSFICLIPTNHCFECVLIENVNIIINLLIPTHFASIYIYIILVPCWKLQNQLKSRFCVCVFACSVQQVNGSASWNMFLQSGPPGVWVRARLRVGRWACFSVGGKWGCVWGGVCVLQWEKEKKWVREEVMKGESRGRWDTLMMLILGLSHRWYEWFLFGWSSSRTPGVLLSFLLLFIYLPILSPDPPPPPHIYPNGTTTLLFWLPC